jgi:hypothetical protein
MTLSGISSNNISFFAITKCSKDFIITKKSDTIEQSILDTNAGKQGS